jgi:hypothetical protein
MPHAYAGSDAISSLRGYDPVFFAFIPCGTGGNSTRGPQANRKRALAVDSNAGLDLVFASADS